MDQNPDIQLLIKEVRRENQRTRVIFGISIIVLAVILTFISPVIIRSTILDSGTAAAPSDGSMAVPGSGDGMQMSTSSMEGMDMSSSSPMTMPAPAASSSPA